MSEIELLTPPECAELRRCSQRTLDRERASNIGPAYVRIGSRIFYRRADIERFIEANVNKCSAGGNATALGAPSQSAEEDQLATGAKS